jgi:hypothetical protein
MVSSPVEGDTKQGSNPGGIKKIPSLATQKILAGRWPVAPAVGLGPPTRGSCNGRQPSASWSAQVTVRSYRVKLGFGTVGAVFPPPVDFSFLNLRFMISHKSYIFMWFSLHLVLFNMHMRVCIDPVTYFVLLFFQLTVETANQNYVLSERLSLLHTQILVLRTVSLIFIHVAIWQDGYNYFTVARWFYMFLLGTYKLAFLSCFWLLMLWSKFS